MRVTLIGGAGFIGGHLQGALQKQNHLVRCLDIDDRMVDFIDVCSPTTFSGIKGSEAVINLAAEHRDDVRPVTRYREVNVSGARNLCEQCSEAGINKIIFISSVAIYGDRLNTEASDDHVATSEYGASKMEAESVYRSWQRENPLERSVTIIRPTAVFGEEQKAGNVLRLIEYVCRRRFLLVGSGDNYKSLAYVKNVADFIIFTLSEPAGISEHDYVDEPSMTTLELISAIEQTCGLPQSTSVRIPRFAALAASSLATILFRLAGRSFVATPNRIKAFTRNTNHALRTHHKDFRAAYTLEEGLHKTVHAYKAAQEASKFYGANSN